MTILGPAGQSLALNAVHAAITHLALHNSTGPGTTGANEYSTARQPVGSTPFTTSSAGSAVTNNNAYTWATAGASAVGYVGGFTALTAGTYEFGWTLGATVTAASITAAAAALSATAS